MVLVWPVFGHGCHSGDHDDELAISPPALKNDAARPTPRDGDRPLGAWADRIPSTPLSRR
jgi:hypothetical protein